MVSLLARLPAWVSTNLTSPKSWKLLARCWLASWIAFVLLLPDRSLSVLGNAAFFALLASLIIPPNMPVQAFFFAISTMIFGMLLGWAIGSAGMAAALASRNQLLLKQSLEKAQQSFAGLSNPDALFQLDIFNGTFLDTRSSVVFGCFLGIGTFIFALIRAYVPKLIMLSIFGTIFIDIFCTFGPLFPFAEYTIVDSLFVSVSSYAAVAVVVICVVFPFTMSSAQMQGTAALLRQIKGLVAMQQEALEATPEDLADGSVVLAKMGGMRTGIVAAQQGSDARNAMINLEFSWGAWNGDDIKNLSETLRLLVVRTGSLQNFFQMVGRTHTVRSGASGASSETASFDTSSAQIHTTDSYLLRQLKTRREAEEALYSVRPADLMPIVRDSTADLRGACVEALDAVQTEMDKINDSRYSLKPMGSSTALDEGIEKLKAALDAFKESKRLKLFEPFEPVISAYEEKKQGKGKDGKLREELPLRALYLSAVFGSNMIWVSNALINFCELVRDTAHKRQRNRLWAPKGLRAIGKVLLMKDHAEQAQLGEDAPLDSVDNSEEDEKVAKVPVSDPDSKPPSNAFQRGMSLLHAGYTWANTAEATFAFKYVILTIALWLPSVFKTSAGFYYGQKGVWALIMAQMTLGVYISDQIYSIVMRLIGTFIGLVVGLLVWYIGSGSGTGSRYGLAASMGVFLVPVLFFRIFSPPQLQMPIIMFSSTFALVVGYSWLDGHLPQFRNPGIGWSVAWRRFTLVVIGFAASFVIMLIPPTSGRKAVRLRNASTITQLSRLYSDLVATWIADTEVSSNAEKPVSGTPKWRPKFRSQIVALAGQLQALKVQTAVAKWEGHIRGAWAFEEYNALANTQSDMVSSLIQLAGALNHLDPVWRSSLLHRTKVLNPHFVTDVLSIFALVSQSLRTGEPMLQVLPHHLLDRLFYHHTLAPAPGPPNEEKDQVAEFNDKLRHIRSLDAMYFSTGIVAVYQVLSALDELHRLTVVLCGEVPLKGFQRWKEEYERAHTTA